MISHGDAKCDTGLLGHAIIDNIIYYVQRRIYLINVTR